MWSHILEACGRVPRVLPVLLLGACSTYEGGWTYVPDRSVHQTVLDGPAGRTTVAQVTAHIVGVMREKDGEPRRLHVRMTVNNLTDEALYLLTTETMVTTTLPDPHPCQTTEPVLVPGHDQRWLDLMFVLPERRSGPKGMLQEITVSWALEQGDALFTSEAPFRRVPQPPIHQYWYGSWGSYWDPWPYWHGGYVRWTVYPEVH